MVLSINLSDTSTSVLYPGTSSKNIGTGYPHNKGPFTSNDSETRWQPQMSNKYHVVACDDEVSAMIYDEVVLRRCFFSAIGGYCDILLNILPIFPQSKPPDEVEERNGGEYDYWHLVWWIGLIIYDLIARHTPLMMVGWDESVIAQNAFRIFFLELMTTVLRSMLRS